METRAELLTESYHGFPVEELSKAFDLVKPESHWKDPIESYCTSDEIKIISAAFDSIPRRKLNLIMSAELVKDVNPNNRFKLGDNIFKVTAIGYRQGPAGGPLSF